MEEKRILLFEDNEDHAALISDVLKEDNLQLLRTCITLTRSFRHKFPAFSFHLYSISCIITARYAPLFKTRFLVSYFNISRIFNKRAQSSTDHNALLFQYLCQGRTSQINGLDKKTYRQRQISTIIFEKIVMNFEINPISSMKDLVLEDVQKCIQAGNISN